MSFQTTGLDRAVTERISGVIVRTGEGAGYVGVIVCRVLPEHSGVYTGIGIVEPQTTGRLLGFVLANRCGVDTRQRIGLDGSSRRGIHRRLDIDTTTLISDVLLENRTADEGEGFEVQTTTICLGFVVLNDAVAHVGKVCHDGTGTDTVVVIRRVRISVLEEETVYDGAVEFGIFLAADTIELITLAYYNLVGVKQVLREGHDVVASSFSTGRGNDLTGEHCTIGQRVAVIDDAIIHACGVHNNNACVSDHGVTVSVLVVVITLLVTTLDIYTARDDEGVVKRIVVVSIVAMLRRTCRGVPSLVLAAINRIHTIALEPYFDGPSRVGLTGYGLWPNGLIRRLRH